MWRKLRRSFFTLFMLVLLLSAVPAQGVFRPADGPAGGGGDEYAFVQFADPPLASYNGGIAGYPATKPAKGEKLDLNSPAAQKYGKRLESQRQNYIKWLARHLPQVEVAAQYAITLNAVGLKLNGADLKAVSRGPGAVQAVASGTYYRAMNVSHDLINSPAVWTALGDQDSAGAGIMVGVLDSGIDQTHPFLHDGGMTAPAGFPRGWTAFTSNKVIVAKVFHHLPFYTPEAIDSHGTHVAGTIAGRAGTAAPSASGLSGVAPGAWLGNYNVFPGNVGSAYSLFIAKAVEAAVADGMDVINMSLSGGAHKGADLLDMAVDAAVDAGLVVALAASNSGPGFYTVGSPGTADRVITVAATSNSHMIAMRLSSFALAEPTVATTGTQGGAVTAPLTGTYEVWSDYAGGDRLACDPIDGTPLAGKIALIQRGVCYFSTKINNAAAAGAVAVIIYQRDDENEPFSMATDGVTIPAVMISRDAGYLLRAWTGDRTVSVSYPPEEVAADADILAGFSSWGPTPNYTLKPDVAAPGTNVYSAVVGGGFEAWGGTSMATPHVAGAAALLLAHSRMYALGWGPDEVKAALVGTGRPALSDPATALDDPLKIGGGIIDLARAVAPPAMAYPSSLSFGLVRPVGNHQYSITFRLTNSTAGTLTYTLTDAGGNLSLSAGSVTLAAGESAALAATVANRGDHSPGQAGYPELRRNYLEVDSGAGMIRIPYLYVMDYNR